MRVHLQSKVIWHKSTVVMTSAGWNGSDC